jgi:hypothetical protein
LVRVELRVVLAHVILEIDGLAEFDSPVIVNFLSGHKDTDILSPLEGHDFDSVFEFVVYVHVDNRVLLNLLAETVLVV